MRNKTKQATQSEDLPHIDPTSYYDTKGAATVLGLKESALRQWRFKGTGPKYQQPHDRARCLYLGSWLIAFRRDSIREPGQHVRSPRR